MTFFPVFPTTGQFGKESVRKCRGAPACDSASGRLGNLAEGHVTMWPRRSRMMRQTLAGMAWILAAMLAVAAVPVQAAVFSDIQGDPNQRGVEKLAITGVMSGFPDGTFKPGQ